MKETEKIQSSIKKLKGKRQKKCNKIISNNAKITKQKRKDRTNQLIIVGKFLLNFRHFKYEAEDIRDFLSEIKHIALNSSLLELLKNAEVVNFDNDGNPTHFTVSKAFTTKITAGARDILLDETNVKFEEEQGFDYSHIREMVAEGMNKFHGRGYRGKYESRRLCEFVKFLLHCADFEQSDDNIKKILIELKCEKDFAKYIEEEKYKHLFVSITRETLP